MGGGSTPGGQWAGGLFNEGQEALLDQPAPGQLGSHYSETKGRKQLEKKRP